MRRILLTNVNFQTQDFVQALRSLGEPLPEPILSAVLREVDPNGDNQFNIDSKQLSKYFVKSVQR